MSLMNKLRRSPPACALIAVGCFLAGLTRFSRRHLNKELAINGAGRFRVFRHVTRRTHSARSGDLFVVRFKFARFSHRVNRWLSLIPVLLIAGFPGFRDKLWLVDEETGYWLGLYRFESVETIAAYKRSFVLGVMNRRSRADTVAYAVIAATRLQDYLDAHSQSDDRGQLATGEPS
jgi:hypothetical protein